MSAVSPEVARLASVALACAFTAASLPAEAATMAPPSGQESAAPAGVNAGEAEDEAADPQAKVQAQRLADDGRQLFWKGEYEAAIEAFSSAYEVFPDPNLLFNISAAHEKQGDYEQALAYLERYESVAPATEADSISARRRELERAREAAAAEATSTDADGTTGGGDGPVRAEGPSPGDAIDLGASKPEPLMNPVAWSMLGLTVIASGVGAGFGLSARGLSKRAGADCASSGGQLRCPVDAQRDLDRARRQALTADIAFGVAGAAGVATLVLIGVRAVRRRKTTDAVAVRPRASGFEISF